MTSRRNTRLAAAGAWMMAWSALAGAARIALGEPRKTRYVWRGS